LLEGLDSWVQIEVIHHEGVGVGGSQKDQKGLTRGFGYQVLYDGGGARIIGELEHVLLPWERH
jgi:hypothetical protein